VKAKTVIIITGPTASGKTSLSIRLAQRFNTSIISADSRQCYTELNIGVAKPSPEELAAVKHYFINSHSIHREVNAAGFEQYALHAANEIFQKNDIAIMVGGTGLYIKAFEEGLDLIPEIPAELRNNINQQYIANGLQWLQQEVEQQDPEYYASGEIMNPQRLLRALEVKLTTGRSIRAFQKKNPVQRDFHVIRYAIDIPKEQLHQNINSRTDQMIRDGLEKEAAELLPYRHLVALQTVGYTEMFEYFDGKISFDETVERIKISTRQYAKRQFTWIRKTPSVNWVKPDVSVEEFDIP